MTKKNFLFLIATVMGALLFALGMCMWLLPEWHAQKAGVALIVIGAIALLAIALIRWNMAGRPVAHVHWKKAGKIAYCIAAALVLGTGMAMVLAMEGMLISGMIVGVAGILLLLGIIPIFKGLK